MLWSWLCMEDGTPLQPNISRVGMLYSKYLGFNGLYAGWKCLFVQFALVAIYSTADLSRQATNMVMVSINCPSSAGFDPFRAIVSWLCLITLFVNSIYPSVCMFNPNFKTRARAWAFDLVCDQIYLIANFSLVIYSEDVPAFPTNPFEYLSIYLPVAKLVLALKVLEYFMSRSTSFGKRNDKDTLQPSIWALILHPLLCLGTIFYFSNVWKWLSLYFRDHPGFRYELCGYLPSLDDDIDDEQRTGSQNKYGGQVAQRRLASLAFDTASNWWA